MELFSKKKFLIGNASCVISQTKEAIESLSNTNLDFIVTKTCTLYPRTPKNIFWKLNENGVCVNQMKLHNSGFEYYSKIKISKPLIISIAGSPEEIEEIMCTPSFADIYEINISCPNVIGFCMFPNLDAITCLQTKYYGLKLNLYLTEEQICEIASYLNMLAVRTRLVYIVVGNSLPNGILFSNGTKHKGSLSGKGLESLSLFNAWGFRKYLNPEVLVFACGGVDYSNIENYRNVCDGVQMGTSLMFGLSKL